MHCARCGTALAIDDKRCPQCGAHSGALAGAPPLRPDAQGIPIARFRPTPAGPPTAPEPYLSAGTPLPLPVARKTAALRIVPPVPATRHTRMALWSSVILALFVFAGLATGALVLTGTLPLPLVSGRSSTPIQSLRTPGATATPVCAIVAPVAAATAALASAQLTTGVRDEQTQDFRPIDNVTTFHAGARAFITFQIVTQAAGIAEVTFCTPQGTIPGTLYIPAGSRGRYAQFSLLLPQEPLGDCVATLEWNGAAAASLPFSVEPSMP